MNISKIKSNYVLYILFSYISTKKAIKIIKYNKYLGKKLNYKQLIFVKKIEKYDNYHFINNYWVQFKNEINDNILKKNIFVIYFTTYYPKIKIYFKIR